MFKTVQPLICTLTLNLRLIKEDGDILVLSAKTLVIVDKFPLIHGYSYNDISVDELSVDLDKICSPEYMDTQYNDISVDELSVDLDNICSPEYMDTHILIFQLMN